MELRAGEQIDDRYTVGPLLGQGGFANVYFATDTRLGTPVAIKVLSLSASSIQERLRNEGRVQARLQHPNVLAVTDIVEVDGHPGLVMPFIAGPSLEALLEAGALDAVEAEHLARGVLEAVRAAHALGMVHRDLKPANILVDRLGDRLVPKVADFGLVKLLDEDGPGRTRSGVAMGTPRYMAPEQIRDAGGVDARADLFSLGAILYELFCGRPAFEGSDTYSIFNAVVEDRWQRPEKLGIELEPRIREAVGRCLVPDREERVESCAELERLLDGASGPPRQVWRAETLDRWEALRQDATSSEPSASEDTWQLDGPGGGGQVEEASVAGGSAPTMALDEPDSDPVPSPELAPQPLAAPDLAPQPPAAPALVDEAGPAAHRSRPKRWVVLGALVLAVLIASVAALGVLGTKPRLYTVEGAPRVHDDPAVQRLIDQAWAEYRANDDPRADRHVDEALSRGAQTPEVHLLGAAIALGYQDLVGAREHLEATRNARASSPAGELLELLDTAFTRGSEGAWWRAPMQEHLQRYPEDLLALSLFALLEARHTPPDQTVLRRFEQADPGSLLPVQLRLIAADQADDPASVKAIVEERLPDFPRSAVLLGELAHAQLALGEPEQALQSAQRAMQLDPAWLPARMRAAHAAVELGRAELWRALTVEAQGIDPTARARLLGSLLRPLAVRGQPVAVTDVLQAIETANAATGAQGRTNQVETLEKALGLFSDSWVWPDEKLSEGVAALQAAAVQAALSPPEEEAVRWAVARAEQRLAWRKAPPQAPDEVPDCEDRVWVGLNWVEQNRYDLAAPFLHPPLEEACQQLPFTAYRQAGLALLASADADARSANRHLTAFAALWPHAEPDVELVQLVAEEVSPSVLRADALQRWVASHEGRPSIGVAPVVASGIAEGRARAVQLALVELLADAGARTVRLESASGWDDAGVDVVVAAELATLGELDLLRLERWSPDQQVLRGSQSLRADPSELVEALPPSLALLLGQDAPRRIRRALGRAQRAASLDQCMEGTQLSELLKVVVRLEVSPHGAVTDARVISEHPPALTPIARCAADRLQKVRMQPDLSFTAEWPVSFDPRP